MKTVLITGGSSGIGLEMSKIFLNNGFKVFWVALNEEEVKLGLQEIRKHSSTTSINYLIQDLTASDATNRVFNWIKDQQIQLDVLINNAGFGMFGLSHELEMDRELNMIHLNIIACYQLTRLFLNGMIQRNKGTIINISSNSSLIPIPKMALYAATKAFVAHYSLGLNEELKMMNSKVNVITVCPAAIKDTAFKKVANAENIKTFDGLVTTTKKEVAHDVWNAYERQKEYVLSGRKLRVLNPIVNLFPKFIVKKLLLDEISSIDS
ncbi:MAG: SDR family NAD(P)-dependent oxidoreductase [Bacteroidota bacterium]